MSNRYKGAVISATPPSVQSGPGAAFAPGIWTTSQQMQYQAAGTWPLSYDPNFNQTVLLLHGDGTNGAQNNTFLDSSSNNFTITRNGNTTQGSFSPFSLPNGEWSNYFNGDTNSFVRFTDAGNVLDLDADFTVEFWVYQPALATLNGTANCFFSVDTIDRFQLDQDGTNVNFRINGAGPLIASSTKASLNTWAHYAIVRSGSTITLYLNGTSIGTGTSSYSIACSRFTIGGQDRGGSTVYNGCNSYISNFRIVKGTAIAPPVGGPTSPLTAVSGTSLLTCQSNRFVDNSTNALAEIVGTTPSVQPFSPFQPSSAYSTSVNGGSGYFDGSGDYLSAADSASWAFGAGNFTVEGWVYRTVGSASQFLFIQSDNSSAPGTSFFVEINSSNKLNSSVYYNSSSSINITSTADVPINAWTHFALVRTSGTISQYINGVRDGTNGTLSTNSLNDPAQALGIAARNNGGNPVTGYFSSARIIKGTGPYDATSSTLTVPTAPLTAVSGTELLLNFTNAGIFDNTGKNNLETVGNAQIDTTTKKWGTGSLEFDGTGDYLVFPTSNFFNPYQGEYTVEMWIYPTNINNGGTSATRYGNLLNQQALGSSIQWGLGFNSSGQLAYTYWNGSATQQITHTTETISINTWVHVGFTYTSSGIALFVNGVFKSATALTGTPATSTTEPMFIGIEGRTGGSELYYLGFIDDLRITKGVARYTANFTPPNGPFFNT